LYLPITDIRLATSVFHYKRINRAKEAKSLIYPIKKIFPLILTIFIITSCGDSGSENSINSGVNTDIKRINSLKAGSKIIEKTTESGDRIVLSIPDGAITEEETDKISIKEVKSFDNLKFKIEPDLILKKAALIEIYPVDENLINNANTGIFVNVSNTNIFLKQYNSDKKISSETLIFGEFSFKALTDEDISKLYDSKFLSDISSSWQKTKSYINSALWIISKFDPIQNADESEKLHENLINTSHSCIKFYLNKGINTEEALALSDIFKLIGEDKNSDLYIEFQKQEEKQIS